MDRTKYVLDENDMPDAWYNVLADLPTSLDPPLDPKTRQPVSPEALMAIFPKALIEQEMSTERYIRIPREVMEVYRLWRPSPMYRARRLEQYLDTPARIYYKYEGVSPAGSHKPNTAVAQAYYNKKEGILQQEGGDTKVGHRDGGWTVGKRPRPRMQAVRHGVHRVHGEGEL